MIKSKTGKVTIKGGLGEILTDYVVVTKGMFDALTSRFDEDEAKDLLELHFNRAFKSVEDLVDDLKAELRELAKLLDIEKPKSEGE